MTSRMLDRISVPISAWAYQGAADLQGMLSFDGKRLTLGFQTADALLGLIKSKTRELVMELPTLDEIEYGHGWFWLMPYVRVQSNDFSALSEVPGSEGGQLRLSVKFRHRKQAQKLVEALRFARAEALHEALEVDINQPLNIDRGQNPAPAESAVEEMPPPPPKQTES